LPEQLTYKTALTRTIIASLHEVGYEVNVRHALDIGKIIANTDLTAYPTIASLKYLISPVISRNKEEQEIIHQLFDKLDQQLKSVYISPALPPVAPIFTEPVNITGKSSGPLGSSLRQKAASLSWWKKALLVLLVAGVVVFLAVWFTKHSRSPSLPNILTIGVAEPVVRGEPTVFNASYDTTGMEGVTVNWRVRDSLITNQWSIKIAWPDTGAQRVMAYVHSKEGGILDSTYAPFTVLCERPPTVAIQRFTAYVSGSQVKGRNIKFWPRFTDAQNTQLYKYKWYNNGQLAGTDSVYNFARRSNLNYTIRLVVDTKLAHCDTDSITDESEEKGISTLAATGDGRLRIGKTARWNNIGLSLLYLVLLPLVPAFLLYRLLKRVPPATKETATEEEGTEGPFAIEFADQRHTIKPEPELKMLADTLRKRQISDVLKLHVRKTINATIRSGGIPELVYSPLTKPTDYLIFLDKENEDSILTHLYEYLIAKLQKEQVFITVYEYYKEPLYLSNQRLNHFKLPLERVAALNPNTTLFIFGDSRHFIAPLKGALKPWVAEKLGRWKTRVFITPYAKTDWDKKEWLLANAGFVMMPPDIAAQPAIDLVINNQVGAKEQQKLKLPAGYTGRYTGFHEFKALQDYLHDDYLLQWVCSLAVYPTIDWNLTLAIGKALEVKLQQQNNQVELVNYTNLLKLGRISWMQDGQLSQSLRVEMLEHLDNETEALARKTLLQQLTALKEKITHQSIIKNSLDIHEQVNTLLLKSYAGKQLSSEDNQLLSNWIDQGSLNTAEEVYLNKAQNTLLKHPTNRNKSVKPGKYLSIISLHRMLFIGAASLIVLMAGIFLASNLVDAKVFEWWKPKPVDQRFVLTGGDYKASDLSGFITLDSVQYKTTYLNDSTLVAYGLPITDTSASIPLSLVAQTGEGVAEGTFTPNSNQYSLAISTAEEVPVYFMYNGANDETMARSISQLLPTNFRDSMVKITGSGYDTGIHIYYSDFTRDAQVVTETIKMATGITVPAKPSPFFQNNPLYQRAIMVTINVPRYCIPVPISILKREPINEIWEGGSSKRLLNIDISNMRFYYSVLGATDTQYQIEQFCITKKGGIRFIISNKGLYSVFFIRNSKTTSMEFSFCENTYPTMEKAYNVEESNCDHFNTMTLYYEKDPNKIFLPVNGGDLKKTEADKLRVLAGKTITMVNLYENRLFLPAIDMSTILRYIQDVNIANNVKEPSSTSLRQISPFTRSYMLVTVAQTPTTAPVKEPTKEPTKEPGKDGNPNTQQKDPDQGAKPDCNMLFSSIDETRKLQSPAIVCRLDLSTRILSRIPPEVFNFINLQELNLGATTIPEQALDDLRKRLPSCKIIYYRASEQDLGFINFTKDRIDKKSELLLLKIIDELRKNRSSVIRIEAKYSSDAQRDLLQTNINTIKNYFYQRGINQQYGQILESVDNYYDIVVEKDKETLTTRYTESQKDKIQIIGLNFPGPTAK
jgi:hypothetical protein